MTGDSSVDSTFVQSNTGGRYAPTPVRSEKGGQRSQKMPPLGRDSPPHTPLQNKHVFGLRPFYF